MDKSEAFNLLAARLAHFIISAEGLPVTDSGNIGNFKVRGESGAHYLIEIQCFSTNDDTGKVRIVGQIHADGIRSPEPLTQSLTILLPKKERNNQVRLKAAR